MKKLVSILMLFALTMSLTACNKEEELEDYNIPKEGGVVLNELPYSSYLSSNNPVIVIEVERMGEMRLQLFKDLAPNTVNSMIAYIERGDYENNEFHRVVTNFMIQGGRLTDPYCSIIGEMNNNDDYEGTNDLSHSRGVLSMARVGGLYNSQSSQFFIMHGDYAGLDNEYAAFGGLVSGFNILDFIANMQVEGAEVPSDKVVITNITVELNGYVPSDPVCQ